MSNKSTNENRKIIIAKVKANPSTVFEIGWDGYFFNKNKTKTAAIIKNTTDERSTKMPVSDISWGRYLTSK